VPGVAVVTGAAAGLGAAFAQALRHEGYMVVTSDIRTDVATGCDAVVDVADADQVKAWVDDVVAQHGPIEVAVANAGIARATHPLDPWDKGLDDFRTMIGVNLAGAYHLGRAVAPGMAAAGAGNIVLVSTDHMVDRPGRTTGGGAWMDLYDAAKWGLRGLVESWALALGPSGVRVNSLCMGATDTPMLRSFMAGRITPEFEAQIMSPEHVAGVLVDLLREGPTGRTGEQVPVLCRS
jgi:NAD(P)-dependent dehydrogenase (short-subunit alcohol dehydrogenase family)